MSVVYLVQLLHGVTITGVLLGGPLYLEESVPERLRSTAQAVYQMAGVGIGGTLSLLLSGALLHGYGVRTPYLVGGVGALLVAADTLARTVVAPMQLPVGALTALLGVPLFLVLLHRQRRILQ